MNDEKKVNGLRTVIGIINVILLVIISVLLKGSSSALQYMILCICGLVLTTVELILDGISKDGESIFLHGCWFLLWLFQLITAVSRI